MRRRGDLERSIALGAAKRDIAVRIRRVCEGFSEEEFETLVERMAAIDVKYRLRDDWFFADAGRQAEQVSALG